MTAFSVIICTYLRPQSLKDLLGSLQFQTLIPKEILIVDGSPDDDTKDIVLKSKYFLPLRYIKADNENLGLTKQRNLGIANLNKESEIVVFLDDDLILENAFFHELISIFNDQEVIGADGLITNENYWKPIEDLKSIPQSAQVLDNFYLKLASRDQLRLFLGLYPRNYQPRIIPKYGHDKSSLPPSNKKYVVDHLMGGLTAYRVTLFTKIKFSEYFEGYGLYEDYDFSIRASQYGKLISNTCAKVSHHHASQGRPNKYNYGKMVVKNGWYVWRLKHPHPGLFNKFKWHAITLLLCFLKLTNSFKGAPDKRKEALSEFYGRLVSWMLLFVNKPKIQR